MKQEAVIAFNQENVTTGSSPRGHGQTYFAKRDFKKDEEIMRGHGRIIDHQTGHKSVQIGPKKHYVPTKWTGSLWNHSCKPNMYMQTRPGGFPSLYALRPIKKGEELNYHYAMSEYTWTAGTDEKRVFCICGTKKEKHRIPSFCDLSLKERIAFIRRGHVSHYLKKLA